MPTNQPRTIANQSYQQHQSHVQDTEPVAATISCERVGQTVKDGLGDVREKHDTMKNFVDSVVKGIIAKNEAPALLKSSKKKKKPKKKASPELEEHDFDLFDDEDAFEDSSSDDSDWAPDTPAPQKKRRTNRGGGGGGSKTTKSVAERDSMSELAGEKISQPDAENNKDNESEEAAPKSSNLESMTVAELKEALKKEGKAVSGRKHKLIKRLRAANQQIIMQRPPLLQPAMMTVSPSITSQAVAASKENKTPPFASSAASPSRSPSSSRKASRKRRAPRRAPLSSDSGSSKASSNQSVTSSQRAASPQPQSAQNCPDRDIQHLASSGKRLPHL